MMVERCAHAVLYFYYFDLTFLKVILFLKYDSGYFFYLIAVSMKISHHIDFHFILHATVLQPRHRFLFYTLT